MKNILFIISFLILATIPRFAQSQCFVFANGYPTTICSGDAVTLYASGGCGYLMANDFNNGTPGVGWTATTGVDFSNPCGSGPDGIYLWMGNQTPIPRTLTTVPFNIVGSCQISFWLRFAVQTGSSGTNCEGPDLAGEGVSVQYSTNNGATWTDIVYFRPDGVLCPSYPNTAGFTNVGANQQTPFTTWAKYTFPIPTAALSPNTRFQFRQHSYSGQFFDHWGLDMVEISCPSNGTIMQWSHGDTSLTTTVYPTTNTMYVFTVTDTLHGQGSVADTVWISVKPTPTSTFNVVTPICSDLYSTITYSGTGTPAATYNWGFSGGQVLSGNGSGPYQVTWPLPGWQYISLDVSYDGCHSQTRFDSVFVNLAPTAVFMGSPTQGCMPLAVQFTDLTAIGSNWFWNFGDGATSTLQNPVHTYNSPGNYNVELIVATDASCNDTLVMQNYVRVYDPPDVNFSANITKSCTVPATVQFTSTIPNVSTYLWNFGDGTTSNDQNPVHTYLNFGQYDVELIVTTNDGCFDTLRIQNFIKIYQPTVADFTFTPDIGKVFNPTFTFYANYPNATLLSWNFGDGTQTYSFSPVSHTYAQVEGVYNVTLILIDENGCSDTITKSVEVIDVPLVFPNVITPNGDGKNDKFVITNAEKYPGTKLVIFNRWGKKIFDMDNYDNKWDGEDYPDGTYFYIFRYFNKEYSGSLTIIRGGG